MSTRTYNLRARADAGVANQPQAEDSADVPLRNPSSFTREAPPHLVAGNRGTGRPALYSEVVTSRSPSPQKEASSTTVVRSATSQNKAGVVTATSVRLRPEGSQVLHLEEISERYTSSEESVSPPGPGDTRWTTVKRRRARSLGALDQVRTSSSPNDPLTLNQMTTVEAAVSNMTGSQKETVSRRHRKVTSRRDTSVMSKGEGTSRPKGKGIDPREWGNLNISQEELNIEAQAAALKSLTREHKIRRNRLKNAPIPEGRVMVCTFLQPCSYQQSRDPCSGSDTPR